MVTCLSSKASYKIIKKCSVGTLLFKLQRISEHRVIGGLFQRVEGLPKGYPGMEMNLEWGQADAEVSRFD